MLEMRAQVVGTSDSIRVLRTLDSDLYKVISKEVLNIGKDIQSSARGRVPDVSPMSGWLVVPPANPRQAGRGWPPWASSSYRASIKVRRQDLNVYVSTNEASGNIFDLAGSKNKNLKPQGPQFIRNIDQTVPLRRVRNRSAGRVMIPALVQHLPDARERMQRIVDRVVDAVNRRLG